MKYIVYFLTIVLPAIQCVAGDTFVFQQDRAIFPKGARAPNERRVAKTGNFSQ